MSDSRADALPCPPLATPMEISSIDLLKEVSEVSGIEQLRKELEVSCVELLNKSLEVSEDGEVFKEHSSVDKAASEETTESGETISSFVSEGNDD